MNFTAVLPGIILSLGLALAARGDVPRLTAISVAGPGLARSATATGASGLPFFSADGRFVVFASDAANLTDPLVPGSVLNVYRRDLLTGITELISAGGGGQGADGVCLPGGISADGRYVLFSSTAGNLIAAGTNATSEIYLRDTVAGTTTLESVAKVGGGPGRGDSAFPTFAGPGRVVFESQADNLTLSDTNGFSDVFLRDLAAGTTLLVSARTSGLPGNGAATRPVASADGSVIVFNSDATNLVPAVVGPPGPAVPTDLHVRQLALQATTRIRLDGFKLPTGHTTLLTYNAVLSADGRYLAFRTESYGITVSAGVTNRYGGVYWFDLQAGTNVLASGSALAGGVAFTESSGPVMSPDGRSLAFEMPVTAGGAKLTRVQVWNADNGLQTLDALAGVSGPASTEPYVSLAPTFSPDGARLLLLTDAFDPVLNGPAGAPQLQVRTLLGGAMRLLTADAQGLPVGGVVQPDAAFSPDGHLIVWSAGNDLVLPGDANGADDVVLTDLETGKTTGISLAVTSPAPVTADGSSQTSDGNAVSDDGRRILFLSLAPDVVANDVNGAQDAFVRDLPSGQNLLIAMNTNGTVGNARVSFATLSADGTHVAFASAASDLAEGDANGRDDVYLRNLTTGETRLVSRSAVTQLAGNNASGNPSISADGRFVAFGSTATDLVPGTTGAGNVFLYDDATQTTVWISRNVPVNVPGLSVAGNAWRPVISADGSTVAFFATTATASSGLVMVYRRAEDELYPALANNFNTTTTGFSLSGDGTRLVLDRVIFAQVRGLILYDVLGRTNRTLYGPPAGGVVSEPRISRDGRRAAFAVTTVTVPIRRDVYAVDVPVDADTPISDAVPVSLRLGGLLSNGDSDQPSISGDGRLVAFHSRATNLVAGDTNGWADVFVADLKTGGLLLASRTPGGASGNSVSANPQLSNDGHLLVFRSFASDLVPGDANNATDVFALPLVDGVNPDTDGDGLPDAWELLYFGNLDHTGTADDDGDGMSNRDEFLAGTVPTDGASVLRLLSPRVRPDGAFEYEWLTAAGVKYVLRFRDSLETPWQAVDGLPVIGSGARMTGFHASAPAAAQRFYQLMIVP